MYTKIEIFLFFIVFLIYFIKIYYMEIFFVRHGQSTENIALQSESEYDASNIILTEVGKTQAHKTGEYLKMYGAFDMIFTSKAERCVETANIIKSHIETTPNLKITHSDDIFEVGETSDFKNMSSEERKNAEKEINEKMSEFNNEPNVFKKLELLEEFERAETAQLHFSPSIEDQFKGLHNFLDMLKNLNTKRVLVICHGGTITTLTSIITNIPRGANAHLMVRKQTSKTRNPEPMIELNNCVVMSILYKNGKFQIVSAANNLHLK